MAPAVIEIYTDGSCHAENDIGGWAAMLLYPDEKIRLTGAVQQTTHNRMELLAVIKAIEAANEKYPAATLVICTDSQYVQRIPERKEKFIKNNYLTKKGQPIQNEDLVKTLIHLLENLPVSFVKIKAHQKPENNTANNPLNYNREVDKLAREAMRELVKWVHGELKN